MILRPPKIPAIYNQVHGWWNNGGNIQYERTRDHRWTGGNISP
ncbi:hypothetical protein SAMN05216386_0564 [Nitrosospira briensis]|uniref:Uncharacterized protein n=1 Tax=Nitrosospira briensis TaxID=35799 RepID=A0A1I4Y853_9PROT|nr:hypothetical protein [Nitrosospira briensis]SFN34214.1 hypothetical protein SAMN05216386_0564 [Nitrosospira briensis]